MLDLNSKYLEFEKNKTYYSYKYLFKFLQLVQFVIAFNGFRDLPENYFDFYKQIENTLETQADSFETPDDYKVAVEALYNILECLKCVYASPVYKEKLHQDLMDFSDKLSVKEVTKYEDTLKVEDLSKNKDFKDKLTLVKEKLAYGELLNIYEAFPKGYYKTKKNGIFLEARSAWIIRKTFGYPRERVKSLEDIGFIIDESFSFRYMHQDKDGKKYYSDIVSNRLATVAFPGLKYKKENIKTKTILLKFRMIVGLNKEKHIEAIKALNAQGIENRKIAHSVKHKLHKPHRTYTYNKTVKVYVLPDGELITGQAYAERHGIRIEAARKRLKALGVGGRDTIYTPVQIPSDALD